jgi:hypothetical protein
MRWKYKNQNCCHAQFGIPKDGRAYLVQWQASGLKQPLTTHNTKIKKEKVKVKSKERKKERKGRKTRKKRISALDEMEV